MKKIILALSVIVQFSTGILSAQQPGLSSNQNYVSTRIFNIPGVNKNNLNETRTAAEVSHAVKYLDGLSRPVQETLIQGSPGLRDIVRPISYDLIGRETKQYLPYSAGLTAGNGNFKANALNDQGSFYTNPSGAAAPNVTATQNAYSELHFEASPLNLADEQGAPGTLWKIGSDHTQRIAYRSNNSSVNYTTDGFAVRLYNAVPTSSPMMSLTGIGYYGTNELTVKITKNENWTATDGKAGTVEEYMDKDGHQVLVRKFNKIGTTIQVVSTYYIYDIYGNLSFVLPPAANPDVTSLPAQYILDNYCYQYRYDDRNRPVEKKLPGKGWDFIVYNDMDQPVAIQDAIQRTKTPQEWLVIKYDVLGRMIITGIYADPSSVANANYRSALQAAVDAETVFWETRTAGLDYTNTAFPRSGMDIQTVNYYDDYNFPGGDTYTYAGASTKTKGLQTGSKTKILGTSSMLLSASYYDDEGRPAKSFKQHYLGGIQNTSNYDEVLLTYNFADQLINSTRIHHAGAVPTTITKRYTYDHTGRSLTAAESINGAAEVILSKLEYNEIGQPIKKSLHSTNGTSFIQNSTYAYNERGWLSKINDPNTLTADKIFGMELVYGNKADTYNGNIGTINWKTKVPAGLGLTEQLQSYTYDYDKLNRLSKAAYSAIGAANKFNEELSYDIAGNISTLKRANSTSGYLNNFSYNYGSGATAGNQLLSITDAGTAAQSSNYTYNENGSQKTDSRKGLTIAYNIMNLPQTISKTSTGESLNYVYDASGQKLRKISGNNSKDYINGIEYNNGVIEFIRTAEGRALPGSSYMYEYMLKDQLGNTRAAFKQNGEVIQVQDYYAFGLEMNPGNRLTPSPVNSYNYNGKEKQSELALEQLDYGARFYDPVIGRWNVIDPLAALAPDLSPFRYCYNNPINFTDPAGLAETDLKKSYLLITDPGEISAAMAYLKNVGGKTTYDNMFSYVASSSDFIVHLPELVVFGKDYITAGARLSALQEDAAKRLNEVSDRPGRQNEQTQKIARNENSKFEGIPVYTVNGMGKGAGVTLPGIGIFISSESAGDVDLLRHEFGHVLQANQSGKISFYLFNAIPSLASATWGNISSSHDHHTFYTEMDANDASYYYFRAPVDWNKKRFPLKPSYDQNPVHPYSVPTDLFAPLFY